MGAGRIFGRSVVKAVGVAAMILVGCGGGKAGAGDYRLKVSVNPANGGSISISPNKDTYNEWEDVNVTAEVADGYLFTGWSGDDTSKSKSVTIKMSGNKNKKLTANFITEKEWAKDLGIMNGNKLVLTERLARQRFYASYGESVKNVDYTDGDFIEIPEKTVFEVFITPKKDAKTIETRIVKATINVADKSGKAVTKESEDENELTRFFIPQRYRTSDYLYYTITLPIDFLGTKLKKME